MARGNRGCDFPVKEHLGLATKTYTPGIKVVDAV